MNKIIVYKVLAKQLNKKYEELMKLPTKTKLIDLGMESLDFIKLIIELEKSFQIEILDSDLLLSNFETLDMLFCMLNKYISLKNIPKKVIVCDCDNVLWHGISGEETVYIDESHIMLQQKLLDLYNKGILVCLCSRNSFLNINNVFTMFDMPLKMEHIIVSKFDSKDKSSDILEISNELQLSLESFVFLDDSDYEVNWVNFVYPQIVTIKVDYNQIDFIEKIDQYFDFINENLINRTELYRQQKKREQQRSVYLTIEEYNLMLNTKTSFLPVSRKQVARIAELSNRTHRFNLSNRIYTTNEIEKMLSNNHYYLYYLRASDNYGDMGIVGAVILKQKNKNVIIESFFLSCRVLERNFENVIINEIKCRFADCCIFGVFSLTEQNYLYKDFYRKNEIELYKCNG